MTGLPRSEGMMEVPGTNALVRLLDRFFRFSERGSSFRTEIIAGLTTFSTYSYILIVNPLIMKGAGMDFGAMITATAVVAAVFTVMMGLWTNYPLGMAPGMGGNTFIAVQVCQGMHIPWQAAIGMVFYSGVLFFILSISGFREKMIHSFPDDFKKIIGVGIGLFVAFIGLKEAGLVVANPRTMVALGHVATLAVLLPALGLIMTIVLVYRKVPAALILSILILTVAGLFVPDATSHAKITQMPARLIDWPNSMGKVFLQLDLGYFWKHLAVCIPIVLALLFSDIFSALGVLLAVGARSNLNDEHGNLPKLKQAFSADATAAMGGSLMGTNMPIIYLESTAGVEGGGRTGLVSIVIAICFLLSLFLTPVIAAIPSVATAPVLIMIGIFMLQQIASVNVRDLTVAATALVTLLLMVMASVSDAIALGFTTWVLVEIFTGRWRTIKPFAYFLAALFIAHYIFM
jgi:AGZA family xanthine/uracil permease-like MFS transporter